MKILMVCLGNICRSPLAEGIMRKLIQQDEIAWEVASAGTGNWHVGQQPDRRSIAVAEKFGYDISQQRARHFTSAAFEEFDQILVMDRHNLKDVLSLAKNSTQQQKVKLFLTQEMDVADPYYDNALFEPVFLMIESRCKELLKALKEN